MKSSKMSSVEKDQRRFYQTKTCRLICMLCLTLTYFVVELVVGNITKSVALIADAFHMLSDVISLIIGIVAVRFSKRQSEINTYGWVRAEVVGANINSVFLLALCLTIIFDAIKRFIEPEPIENVNLLLIVGSIGFGINLIGLLLFHGFHGHTHGSHGHTHGSHGHAHGSHEHSHESHGHTHVSTETVTSTNNHSEAQTQSERRNSHMSTTNTQIESTKNKKKNRQSASMNMHGVFLHVMADALGSIAVIISALIIKFVPHDPQDEKHWTVYIDPTLSVIIVIIISISTFPLFRETAAILLQTIPRNMGVEDVKLDLLRAIPEVNSVHELHIWRLTDEKVIASAHLHRTTLDNYMLVAEKVKAFFHSIGIHSLTIQYESIEEENASFAAPTIDSNDGCLLRCRNDICEKRRCCTIRSVSRDSLNEQNETNRNLSNTHQYDNPIVIELTERNLDSL